ncbi:glycosyltransferase family A protein [Nesterenkonia sp. CL21]|uniref:glycosyltransferase family A protein n=1 Tax=Nesterenkonia sp. CL21 TaxID=3064894 RepID=UPI00287A51DF|nr:glycosyltransferase family A protein [Nesterenkonia sp. CL21]MDS2172428.1 glycosyltransferase family A protein [Nesterenkonia sp. CL21]
MSRARLLGPSARQSELDEARERIVGLVASRDPLRQLLEPGALQSLGVRDSSPFWGGRAGAEAFLDQLMPALEALPPLEAGVSRPALPKTVAVLGDPDLMEVLAGAADLRLIDPDDWESTLSAADAVLLSPRTVKAPRARGRVITAAREAAIPLIYCDTTLPEPGRPEVKLAARCDVVLTTSEEGAEEYRRGVPSSVPVATVVQPVSPLRRSPLGSRTHTHRLVTHLERRRAGALDADARRGLQWIHDGIVSSGSPLLLGLEVRGPGARRETLPVRHRPYCAPSAISHAPGLDRLSPVGVVTQAVAGSQTFFSPRTLDLLASGSLVLSTYNQGLNSHYPEVRIANSAEDVAVGLESLELEELRRAQGDGVRHAFRRHHAVDVLRTALGMAGISVPEAPDRVLAVASGDDAADPVLAEQLRLQTAGAVETVTWDELTGRHGDYDVLVPVSSAHSYAPTYVEDHLAALAHQSCPVTAKVDVRRADAGDPHAQRHHGAGALAAEEVPPSGRPLTELALSAWFQPPADASLSPETLIASLQRVHLSDHLGHRPRRGHTVVTSDGGAVPGPRTPSGLADGDDLETVRREVAATAEREGLQLSVIVPVYDNGDHLRHKAFASLRRSSIFETMHVLLISDGSTDPSTVDTVEELAAEHPNVTSFHHGGGGSGSASRPRNTGLDLAQTPFVTYLDPDNEAIEDGYAQLLEDLRAHEDVDFVLGNMSQWARHHTRLPYAGILEETFADHAEPDGTLVVPDRALEALRFRPLGIQTVVARTGWLKSLGISQPLGAVGQDSYFFQQMLHYARRIRTLDVGVHTYYMAVSSSTINTLNPGYFKKYLPLDSSRARWLQEVGLLEAYRRDRLERFLVSWHLPKLKRVRPEEWFDAAENLAELLACYGDHEWTDPAALEFWDDLDLARRRESSRRRRAGERTGAG